MKASVFALLAACALPLMGQQLPQNVLSTIAGMRADLSQLSADNRRLTLRIEDLEKLCADQSQKIQDLQNLCATQNNQMEAMSRQWQEKMNALQAAADTNNQRLQTEIRRMTADVSATVGKLAAQTSAPPPAAPSGKYIELKVERGDTLGTIAKAAGVTVKAIKDFNNLSSDTIFVGQVLKIPQK